MTNKTKKIIAREFLFLLGAILLFIVMIFIWKILNNKNIDKEKNLKQKIENISQNLFQNEYYYNNEIYLESELYKKYGKSLESKIKEHGYIKRTEVDVLLDDFFGKYTNEKLSSFKRNKIKLTYNENFDSLIKNLYSENLNETIKTEKIQLIKKVYGLETDSKTINEFHSKITYLKNKLNKVESSFFNLEMNSNKIFELGIILFSIFFILRYLFYGTKWSIKKLKE